MGTGTAVSTGDILTAAKMNLKLEDIRDMSAFGLLDQNGVGAQELLFAVSENLTTDRTLTITVNNADRGIDLAGDLTLAGALATSGAFALTLTVTNTTNATIPAGTVTLADLGTAQVFAGAKTFASSALLLRNPAGTFAYTFAGGAILAARLITLPLLVGDDVMVTAGFIQTLTNKTLTAPTINGGTATALTGLGIRSTGAAFDLTIASTEVFTGGRTLTITLNNAARTLSLAGDVTLAGAFTTAAAVTLSGAHALTVTLTAPTTVTLPVTGTIAVINVAQTWTAAQTLDGNVDTVLNVTTSPIIDIGADVFETGTFIDIAYDTAETLTGALIGINVDLSTNVTISNQSVTGLDLTLPGTFGNGTEYGIRVRGDGQTILIGNDTDLYISLAKASSVDIFFQGISPVVDIGADVLQGGYIISIDYDTAEATTADLYILDVFRAANALTLGADLYGVNLDFNSNVVAAADRDVLGYRMTTPALTSAGAVTTNIIGFTLPTAGALVMNNAGGALNFYGLNIQMPNITQTAGAMTAIGIQLTEGTTTSGTINAININGVGVDTIINFSASPIIDVGADVFSIGTAIYFSFDTAETATGALVGVHIDMNTNLTPLGGQDVTAYTCQTPAFTNAAAAATVLTGYQLPTAGALVMNNAGGSITWYGLNVLLPNITQTAGAMVAIGIQLTEGTTTSGTANAINVNGSVDTIVNFSASPILDIGADVFSTGYFADIGFDTIETLTAQLTGIRIDWDTVVVTTGGAGTGNITPFWADMGNLAVNAAYNAVIYGIRLDLDFTVGGAETIYGVSVVLPATFGGGTEVGFHYTGDGQTINIGNDADLYVSFAKANSVDINIQGVTPVIDIGADVFNTGTVVDFAFDTAETAVGALIGVSINMNTNLTPLGGQNVTSFTTQTAAFTNAAAAATVLTGYQLPTAGALVMNNGGGSLTWYGLNVQLPAVTQTAGAMTAIGIQLTEGVTTSGTVNAVNIDGSVDTILNFSASPILDIGADVFSTGYFMDIGFDTIETLTAQLTGIRLDWDTVIVTTGGAGTGNITGYWVDMGQLAVNAAYDGTIYGLRVDMDFTVGGAETLYGASIVTPATYGAGTEVGVHVTGDGQTVNIVNDADLYVSMAKANAVDVNLQAISPVVDIGADVFETGTFIDIAYDTAETLTGALIGVNLNLNTNVTLGGQNINGIIVALPATYGAGAEVGIQVTGDGQTIKIGNDADLYISLAKAGSVDVNLQGVSPVIDIGADVFTTGTFIDIAYDTAEALAAGTLIGLNMDFATNLTYVTTSNIAAIQLVLAAFTQPDASTTTIYGFNLPTAGALVQNTAAGTLDWRGINIQLPNITQTTGTVTAYGVRITEGVTASGAAAGLYIDVDLAIDLVTLGNRIDFDANNDTSLRASADNVLTVEINGTDLIVLKSDAAAATATIQAAGATEIGIAVVNTALTVGTSGSLVIPYLSQTGALFTDAIGGDVDGAIGINYDSDTGPTSTIEVRSQGAWVSVAVSGYLMQSRVPWKPDSIFLSHPNQLYQDVGRDWIDESRCGICGEQMQPGEQATFWINGRYERGAHAIFSHMHLEREPFIVTLEERLGAVEEAERILRESSEVRFARVEREVEELREQVKELGAVPVA